VQFTQTDTLSL